MNDARSAIFGELMSGRAHGPDTIAAQALLAIAAIAAAAFFVRSRRCAQSRARDAALLAELRSCIRARRYSDARDRARRADCRLARMVAAALSFPHGTHDDAIARAVTDAAGLEPAPRRAEAMLLPLCAFIAAAVGSVALIGRPVLFGARDVVVLQSFMTACVVFGVGARVTTLARVETRRVEVDAAEFAAAVARGVESPAIFQAEQKSFTDGFARGEIAAATLAAVAPHSAAAAR